MSDTMKILIDVPITLPGLSIPDVKPDTPTLYTFMAYWPRDKRWKVHSEPTGNIDELAPFIKEKMLNGWSCFRILRIEVEE